MELFYLMEIGYVFLFKNYEYTYSNVVKNSHCSLFSLYLKDEMTWDLSLEFYSGYTRQQVHEQVRALVRGHDQVKSPCEFSS